jgi:hypothetical protein
MPTAWSCQQVKTTAANAGYARLRSCDGLRQQPKTSARHASANASKQDCAHAISPPTMFTVFTQAPLGVMIERAMDAQT